MKHLKLFETQADYTTFIASADFVRPNVSLIDDDDDIIYNPWIPSHDYSLDYFSFVALEDTTFQFGGEGIEYSIDNGTTWNELESWTDSPTINQGDIIMWRGELEVGEYGIGSFMASGNFNVQGNIMSLLYGDNFIGQTTIKDEYDEFYMLFNGCSKLISAENLILPSTTLKERCYNNMFGGCTSLTTAPQLPATTLADYCYFGMFMGCTSLTVVPQLPATTLEPHCYDCMFNGCESLETTPIMLATTLAENCCERMFEDCTSLTNVSELYATTLADYCYDSMFRRCTSLTTAPNLPVTTLAQGCYWEMFDGCTSLTTAPDLPAPILVRDCYCHMFDGCSSLNYIKCLATDISAYQSTSNWLGVSYNVHVPSEGTFVKAASMNDWPTGLSGIPEGWTIQDAE